jgi:DNA-binding protein HU-beta
MPTATAKALTKSQFVTRVSEETSLPKRQVEACLAAAFGLAAKEARTRGLSIIPGLGRLRKVDRKARVGRNPATGASIKIPAKKVVRFRLGKAFAESIVPPKK